MEVKHQVLPKSRKVATKLSAVVAAMISVGGMSANHANGSDLNASGICESFRTGDIASSIEALRTLDAMGIRSIRVSEQDFPVNNFMLFLTSGQKNGGLTTEFIEWLQSLETIDFVQDKSGVSRMTCKSTRSIPEMFFVWMAKQTPKNDYSGRGNDQFPISSAG